MAKHIYSPDMSSIWLGVENADPEIPEPDPIHKVVALLQQRDYQVEGGILGDLVVQNVSGSLGSVTPPQGKQIAWSVNFGAISGTTDADGNYRVTYDLAFPNDTAIFVFSALNENEFGILIVPGTADKTGVTVYNALPTSPIDGGYLAVGF